MPLWSNGTPGSEQGLSALQTFLCCREKESIARIQASQAHEVPFHQISTFYPGLLVKISQPVPILLFYSASLDKECREGVHAQLHTGVSFGIS